MRLRITLASVLGATLAAVVISAWPTQRGTDPVAADHMQLVATVVASGRPIVTNSLDGKPILTIADLRPGQSRSGQVTLKNAGSAAQTVGVWQSGLTSGPSGKPNLAAWVQLAVYDSALGKNVYSGAYQDFPALLRPMVLCGIPTRKNSCPDWAKGETHVFTFTVIFPDVATGSGVNINTYQSTWLRSEFDWAAFI
jgi:hypothetical protein